MDPFSVIHVIGFVLMVIVGIYLGMVKGGIGFTSKALGLLSVFVTSSFILLRLYKPYRDINGKTAFTETLKIKGALLLVSIIYFLTFMGFIMMILDALS